jgi:hypothetical protein
MLNWQITYIFKFGGTALSLPISETSTRFRVASKLYALCAALALITFTRVLLFYH